jgi:hypothetical protein
VILTLALMFSSEWIAAAPVPRFLIWARDRVIGNDGWHDPPSVRMFMEVSNVQSQVTLASGSFDKTLVGAQSTKSPNYL